VERELERLEPKRELERLESEQELERLESKWDPHAHCRNPNLAKCEGEAQHLEKLGIWSPSGLPNVQSSTAGPQTPRIGVFLMSLERS
jgi:hypothetical protein